MLLLRLADLQSIHMGIAMCHFEFSGRTVRTKRLLETWDPGLEKPGESIEHVSWVL